MTYGRAASFLIAMGLHAFALWYLKPAPKPEEGAKEGEDAVEVALVEAAAPEEAPPLEVPPEPEEVPPPTEQPPDPTPPPPEPEPEPPPPKEEMEEPTPAPEKPKPKPRPKPKPVPPATKPGPATPAQAQMRAGVGGSAARGTTDTSRARKRRDVLPVYPSWMRDRRIEPYARVVIVVSAEGKVLSARISQSSGYAEWDQNCLRAANSTPFVPKVIDGVAMEDTVIQAYRGDLKSR
jgi:periplasmic protein TonB